MRKKTGLYVDVDLACSWGRISDVHVTMNGRQYPRVIRAKSGKNGFIEFYPNKRQRSKTGEELRILKQRGNVKIHFAYQ